MSDVTGEELGGYFLAENLSPAFVVIMLSEYVLTPFPRRNEAEKTAFDGKLTSIIPTGEGVFSVFTTHNLRRKKARQAGLKKARFIPKQGGIPAEIS
ncbi:hypothetical protein [Photobacterium ganghwense]|uniref:hypothetical protein n=1 Tax=Photobacterium ganghwense TaxID=320778 RepID=UPI0039EDFB67